MQKRWPTYTATGLVAAGIIFAGSLFAAAPAYAAGEAGVARLAEVSGSVGIRHGDGGTTYAAAQNAPLLVGDYLSTGDASRAEVQYDYGNIVRLASNTQLRFTDLDTTRHIAQLAGGTVDLRVLHSTDANPEIDTPSVGVRSSQAGSYRITVQNDGTTLVTARSGQLSLLTPQGERTVEEGVTLLASGPADNPQVQQVDQVGYDSFDQWCSQRDSFDGNDVGYQYAPQSIPGIADLDQYGQWVNNSQYGESWIPNNEPAGWAPYQNGQWTWEPGYGYTWVGNEPWGYAPYHYGNWYYDNGANNWAWQPTQGNSAATWLPAVVGFLALSQNANPGGSDLLGLLSQFANVGWFPLAPGEQYTPWYNGYGQQPYYGYNLPVTNNYYQPYGYQQLLQMYSNVGVPGAVAVVSSQGLANGGVLRIRRITIRNFKEIVIVRHVVPVLPVATAQRFTMHAVRVAEVAPKAAWFKRFPKMHVQPEAFASMRSHFETASRKIVPKTFVPAARPRNEEPVTRPRDEQSVAQPHEQPVTRPQAQPDNTRRDEQRPVQRQYVPRHLDDQRSAPVRVQPDAQQPAPRHVRQMQPEEQQPAPQRHPDRMQRPAKPDRFQQPAAQRPARVQPQRAPRQNSDNSKHGRPASKQNGNDHHHDNGGSGN